MAKIEISKGQYIHHSGDTVSSLEIIIKGSITISYDDDVSISATTGTMLGATHLPGKSYTYDYVAETDCMLYSYDYQQTDDIVSIIRNNPNIAPIITSANASCINSLLDMTANLYRKGTDYYHKVHNAYEDYVNRCTDLFEVPKDFDEISELAMPQKPAILTRWMYDYCRAYLRNDALLKKHYYSADISFCIGTNMVGAQMARQIQEGIDSSLAYLRDARELTSAFRTEYHSIKSRSDEAQRKNALDSGSDDLPSISGALNIILSYAQVDNKTATEFTSLIEKFKASSNKLDTSDEMRALRREITKYFFEIYELAFFASIEDDDVPSEVMMFFYFGFIDEELAGEENTTMLYKLLVTSKRDSMCKVLPAYEWLTMIYEEEVEPSKNEFDQDWPAYLNEQYRSGNIDEDEMEDFLEDSSRKVSFELNNLVSLANKITYGSILTYVPVFFKEAVLRPLGSCHMTPHKIHSAIDELKKIDYSIFYRTTMISNQDYDLARFMYDEEILPYVILMPNVGSNGSLWQEIEGRKRSTPARIILSMFHTGDLNNTITKICGDYHWEMCKRIQGVHWNDITDPSLTAEYCNYLQFYRKNRSLTSDVKEKVKNALAKNKNNYKNIFISDYMLYIKNESQGQPRLNRVSREIMFKYCTFSKEYRDSLAVNPQYQSLIEHWRSKQASKIHALEMIENKILKNYDELPEEVESQKEFLHL